MSMICRIVIGYFDAHAACAQRFIIPSRPVDEEEVACLQATCKQAFGIKLELSNHLTPDGLVYIEDAVVRDETYKLAAVAHSLFDMSAIDHAHRCVIFSAQDNQLPEQEEIPTFEDSVCLDMDDKQWQQQEEEVRWVREQEEFERAVHERVRSFIPGWRNHGRQRWVTPNVLALARAAYDERRFDVLPILADALEEAGCTDQFILDHLRSQGQHVRGCWAVGLVLADAVKRNKMGSETVKT